MRSAVYVSVILLSMCQMEWFFFVNYLSFHVNTVFELSYRLQFKNVFQPEIERSIPFEKYFFFSMVDAHATQQQQQQQ